MAIRYKEDETGGILVKFVDQRTAEWGGEEAARPEGDGAGECGFLDGYFSL